MISTKPKWSPWNKVVERGHPERTVAGRLNVEDKSLRQAVRKGHHFVILDAHQAAEHAGPNGSVRVFGQAVSVLADRSESGCVLGGKGSELATVKASDATRGADPKVALLVL